MEKYENCVSCQPYSKRAKRGENVLPPETDFPRMQSEWNWYFSNIYAFQFYALNLRNIRLTQIASLHLSQFCSFDSLFVEV